MNYSAINSKQKMVRLLLVSILTVTAWMQNGVSVAQAEFQGVIKSKVSVLESPKEMQGMEDMLNHSIVTYVKGKLSRVEQITASGSSTIIANSNKNEVTMLMDMMGQKIAMVMPMEGRQRTPGLSFDYNGEEVKMTSEKKKFAGYNCQKGFIEIQGLTIEIWFATDIRHSDLIDTRLPGMPLQYTVNDNGLKVRFEVISISEEAVSDNQFVIPSEYQIKSSQSMEEFMPYIFGDPGED